MGKNQKRDKCGRFSRGTSLKSIDSVLDFSLSGGDRRFKKSDLSKFLNTNMVDERQTLTCLAGLWCGLSTVVERTSGGSKLTADEVATNTSYLFKKMLSDVVNEKN